jgi:heptosyltransferase I
MSGAAKSASSILVVRLGAMGDIIHTLPAAASLKHSYPGSHVTWAVEAQWAPLLEGNPFVDRVLPLRRDLPAGIMANVRALRSAHYDFAVDFQGLIKSAMAASAARPDSIFGWDGAQARERAAALFYSHKTLSSSVHVVDRNLDLAAAAGAANALRVFPLPPGEPEAELPEGDFILACPLAGWSSKQWPIAHYGELALRLRRDLGLPLVLNGPPSARAMLAEVEHALPHCSGLPGLIYAMRRAAAVIGVDSGPLHVAAALNKPGVAIFGPTDPARNGPYGGSLGILRSAGAQTTYKRGDTVAESMRQISPGMVFEALKAGCLA